MIFLVLCILSTTGIMVIFKMAGIHKLDTFRLIVINYIIAALFGFIIGGFPDSTMLSSDWVPMAVLIGILFILIFFVMAITTQKSGITSASVAGKMSVVIPISFSIVYFNESISILKVLGIILALISVFLTIYKKGKSDKVYLAVLLFPVLLFFGTGLIDSLVKYTQQVHIPSDKTIMFSSVLFSISAVTGIIIWPFRKKTVSNLGLRKTIMAGLILGIINFGSLYGIINALESDFLDSSIIFGINNIGIVVLSVFVAVVFFNESLSNTNKAGIVLSILTILFLSYL